MKVELELPTEVALIMKIYATILDKTVEEHIIDTLRENADNLGDGEVFGRGNRGYMEGPNKEAGGRSCYLFLFFTVSILESFNTRGQAPIAMATINSKRTKVLLLSVSCTATILFLATFTGIWSPIQNAHAVNPHSYKGVTREFYLTNMDNAKIDENKTGLPADVFNIPEMTVRKGDTVVIHFYNVEPEVDDRHSFTILEGPYATNNPLDGGQNKTITFTANETGIFTYICTFHMPSMSGQLVVSLPTLDEVRAQQ
jgi:plastocyanin